VSVTANVAAVRMNPFGGVPDLVPDRILMAAPLGV
jgi:hypothetical protein